MIHYIDADGKARFIKGIIIGKEKTFGVRFVIIRRAGGTKIVLPESQLTAKAKTELLKLSKA